MPVNFKEKGSDDKLVEDDEEKNKIVTSAEFPENALEMTKM